MPRQRTPLEQAEATGAIDHNRKRFASRQNTPKYGGTLGPAPTYFSPELILIWEELVEKIPSDILCSADSYIVEIATQLIHRLRGGEIKPVELGHLRAALGSLGMTPADRTRVTKANGDEDENDPLTLLLQ